MKSCRHCGKEFDGHHSAKYCLDCRPIIQKQQIAASNERRRLAKVKTCPRCKKEFSGAGKYCTDCRADARKETVRKCNQRYQQAHPRPKPVAKPVEKPVEKFRSLTRSNIVALRKLIREVYDASSLILNFGEDSALTAEQLAIVEQKYPDHSQNLGNLRKQKFFDATDKFIEAYQAFK